jgi:hypothetical protein
VVTLDVIGVDGMGEANGGKGSEFCRDLVDDFAEGIAHSSLTRTMRGNPNGTMPPNG